MSVTSKSMAHGRLPGFTSKLHATASPPSRGRGGGHMHGQPSFVYALWVHCDFDLIIFLEREACERAGRRSSGRGRLPTCCTAAATHFYWKSPRRGKIHAVQRPNGVYSLKWRLTDRYLRWGTLADPPRSRRSVQIEWISAETAHLGFPVLWSVPHLLSREIKMNRRHSSLSEGAKPYHALQSPTLSKILICENLTRSGGRVRGLGLVWLSALTRLDRYQHQTRSRTRHRNLTRLASPVRLTSLMCFFFFFFFFFTLVPCHNETDFPWLIFATFLRRQKMFNRYERTCLAGIAPVTTSAGWEMAQKARAWIQFHMEHPVGLLFFKAGPHFCWPIPRSTFSKTSSWGFGTSKPWTG